MPLTASTEFSMRVHQLQPLFDTVKTRFDTIDPAIDTGHAFFDRGETRFCVVNVVNEAVQLLIDAPQMAQEKAFRFVDHIRSYFRIGAGARRDRTLATAAKDERAEEAYYPQS
jgi:hypothetical protein